MLRQEQSGVSTVGVQARGDFQTRGDFPFSSEHQSHHDLRRLNFLASMVIIQMVGFINVKDFFEYNAVDNLDKVKLASLHLEDSSLQWFQWFERCHHHITWDLFTQGLLSRYGPNSYEDAMGNLTKLRQTTTVRAYQEQFEILANKTQNLPKTFFISCFISGLKDEIQPGVLMFTPTSITQAIGLAKLQETSIEAITKKTRLGTKSEGIPPFSLNRSQVGKWGICSKRVI